MTGLLRRAERRLMGLAATTTFTARAGAVGVRLGPENLCLQTVTHGEVVVGVGVGHIPIFGPWARGETDAFPVIWDPIPKHAPGLRRWVAQTQRAALIDCALSPKNGSVAFFQSAAEKSGSTLGSHLNRARSWRVYDMLGITLGTLLERARQHGPIGLARLDVERVEFSALDGTHSTADSIESVPRWLIEFHAYPKTSHSFSNIARIRRWFQTRQYKSYTRNWIDYLFWR